MIALVGCSGDGGNAEKDRVADGGARGGNGGSGGAADGGSKSEPPSTLFTDPKVPDCATAASTLVGKIDGQAVEFSPGLSSSLAPGHFEFLGARDGTLQFAVRVDGDLGPVNGATSAVTLPIIDATWFTVANAPSDRVIALDCGLGGTVMRSPSTTEVKLTGVGSLAACSGTPATPSSTTFVLRD